MLSSENNHQQVLPSDIKKQQALSKLKASSTPSNISQNEPTSIIEGDDKQLFEEESTLNSQASDLCHPDALAKKDEVDKQLVSCHIGHLYAVFVQDGKKTTSIHGTAFLIAPDIALTVAHNVYIPHLANPYADLIYSKFYLAKKEGKYKKYYQIQEIIIPKEYEECWKLTDPTQKSITAFNKDYCLLFLKTKQDHDTQKDTPMYLKISPIRDIPTAQYVLSIFGYPLHKNITLYNSELGPKQHIFKEHSKIISQPFEEKGQIYTIDESYVYYKHPTEQGHSGSPLILQIRNEMMETSKIVIGLHKGLDNNKHMHCGLSAYMFMQDVNQWLHQRNIKLLVFSSIERTYFKRVRNHAKSEWLDLKDYQISLREVHNFKYFNIDRHFKHLILCGNYLTNEAVKCLTSLHLKNLLTLNLSDNFISSLDGWQTQNIQNLQYLCLSLNQLQDLPQNMKRLMRLKEIWLCFNKFQAFPKILSELESLKSIYIYENVLSEEEIIKYTNYCKELKNINIVTINELE